MQNRNASPAPVRLEAIAAGRLNSLRKSHASGHHGHHPGTTAFAQPRLTYLPADRTLIETGNLMGWEAAP